MADSIPEKEQADEIDSLDAAIEAAEQAIESELPPIEEGQAAVEETAPKADAEAEGGEKDEIEAAGSDGGEAAEAKADGEAKAPVLEAPQDWRADQRVRFAKLPEDAKALALEQYKDMQAGFTRKSQDLSDKARFADSLWSELQPYRDEFAMRGMDERGAVRFLLTAYRNYRTNPAEYLRMAAQGAGIDLAQLGSQRQEEDAYADPAVLELRRRLDAREHAERQQFERAQQDRYGQALGYVQRFTTETDEAGNLKHPHMQRVEGMVLRLVSSGASLEDAYQMAVRSDPDLYGEAIKAAESKARAAAEIERKSAVEKAKQAGRHKVSGAPPAKGRAEPSDLDAIISNAIERTGVGV